MRDIRVAMAQIAPHLGDVERNLDLHLTTAERAAAAGADLAVFPELSLTGYLLRDQVPDVALSLDSERLGPLLEASRRIDLLVGMVERSPTYHFHNVGLYLSGGRVVHAHRKLYLPTYGMFDEGRDLAAGETIRAYDTRFGRFGTLVCEDAWHGTNAWLLAHQGATLMFVPSCGPARGSKPGRITSIDVWADLLRVTAQFQTSWVVYVNRVGVEDGLTFGGGSLIVDPFGRIAGRLPELDEGLEVVALEAEVLQRARNAYPLLRDDDLELVTRELGRVRRERFDLPDDA
jgi:predicted amidohydrolase